MFGNIRAMMSSGLSSGAAKSVVGAVGFELTSSGLTQDAAYEMVHGVNVFTSVFASTGTILNSEMEVGESVLIINATGNDLKVYPTVGADIDGATTNTAITLAASGRCIITKVASDVYASFVGA